MFLKHRESMGGKDILSAAERIREIDKMEAFRDWMKAIKEVFVLILQIFCVWKNNKY